ncbi:hypothetical protein GRAN_4875 [Granulicella sibirica]|uniref:Uncharacterized protein n=1 Tax=Granulicella sibirica TaxID=2479048 RepID=A0A4V1L519_9BACT|nr:hypothetical protein GRAN_4875 [Granulicella sibirica]
MSRFDAKEANPVSGNGLGVFLTVHGNGLMVLEIAHGDLRAGKARG